MAVTDKQMYLKLFKDTAITLVLVAAVIGVSVLIAHYIFKTPFVTTSASLAFGIAGTTLAFIGSMFSLDALSRWGNIGLPQWKWGNKLQMVGFALVIVALLVK
jgi:hypothetical protein